MRLSVILSFLLHCSILLAGAIVLPAPKEFLVKDNEAIPVEILNVSDISKSRAEKPDPKPEKKPEPKPEKKQAALTPPEPVTPPEPKVTPEVPDDVPPPEPIAKPVPEPKPEPKPVPEAKPEPAPEPKKVVETKPVPRPKVRPRPPKKVVKKKQKFSVDRIAALLNKDPNRKPPRNDTPDAAKPAPGRTVRRGQDQTVSQDERDALRAQIERCWNPLIGVQGAEDLVVRVRISLKRDGSLVRPPRVVNTQSNPLFGAAADRATRAIRLCQPFNLPANKYRVWREIILNFDPRKMIRG